jgi:hypothetical protein
MSISNINNQSLSSVSNINLFANSLTTNSITTSNINSSSGSVTDSFFATFSESQNPYIIPIPVAYGLILTPIIDDVDVLVNTTWQIQNLTNNNNSFSLVVGDNYAVINFNQSGIYNINVMCSDVKIYNPYPNPPIPPGIVNSIKYGIQIWRNNGVAPGSKSFNSNITNQMSDFNTTKGELSLNVNLSLVAGDNITIPAYLNAALYELTSMQIGGTIPNPACYLSVTKL